MSNWLVNAWRYLLKPPQSIRVGNHRWHVFAGSSAVIGTLAHLALLPWFALRGVQELVWFNLLSLPIYLFCVWVFVLNPRSAVRWHKLATVLVALELLAHGSIATFLLGWSAGFHYYYLVVPLVALYSPFGTPAMRAAVAGMVGLLYIALWLAARDVPPHYTLGDTELTLYLLFNFGLIFVVIMAIGFFYERAATLMEAELEFERQRSERLLLNTLPASIAQRLKDQPGEAIATRHADVSVLFCDIVGFTRLAEKLPPEQLVAILNRVFTAFDDIADRHQVEKIKTIGDAYMVAAGLPTPCDDPAGTLAEVSLEMMAAVAALREELGSELGVRIGIHSGPVVAGVIGRRKFAYDLWGDVVNTAARMESHGLPGAIQVTEETALRLGERFTLAPRGLMQIKGKGPMTVFLLSARSGG